MIKALQFFKFLPTAPSENSAAPDSSGKPLSPTPLSLSLLIWFIRLSAAINLFCCLLPDAPDLTHWLGPWSPFEISQGRQIRMFMMAILLMILASGLGRGKRIVWLLTMASLTIAPLLHLGRIPIWPQALLNLTIVVFLLFHHRYFVVGSNPRSVRFALTICPLLILVLLAFGTIRLHELRDQTSGDDDWGACFQTATELVLVHHSETQKALTTPMRDFFAYLRLGGTTVAVMGLFLTLRPVLWRRRSRQEQREKVRALINFYGTDPFDSYALLSDKEYFFSTGRAAIPYVLSNNLAIALADPIGPAKHRSTAIAEYAYFCRKQDWEPVFYEVSSELLGAYEEAGLSTFKIGEEARLRSDEFHLRGNDFQNLRTARNHAAKRGLRFRWYNASHGIDEVLEGQLAGISDAWLERKKTREMGFDMGSFTVEDIRRHQVAIALDASGKPLAFATWRPFARAHGQALDLMRTHPTERNIMDFVLVESILSFRQQGIHEISLGTAPLANTQNPGATRKVTEEKAVQFLYENLNRIYGYRSLFEFKRKYRPQWCGRYVAYRRGAHLPLVGLALVRVHARDSIWKYFLQ